MPSKEGLDNGKSGRDSGDMAGTERGIVTGRVIR